MQGCVFALMDVDQEKQAIVVKSVETKNPLKYVPCVLLYLNGIPIAECSLDEQNPASNYERMKQFLVQQTEALKSDKPIDTMSIPMYSIGIPGNKKRVCYLNYSSAYQAEKR
jgi:hypothetical protein